MKSLNEKDILDLIRNEYPLIELESSIQGQMSSIELVDFIVWLEEKFGIKIAGYEVTDRLMASGASLASFIKVKINA